MSDHHETTEMKQCYLSLILKYKSKKLWTNFSSESLGSLTVRFRLLLYRVGDCVMHLCPICNRCAINILDDDDDDDELVHWARAVASVLGVCLTAGIHPAGKVR